MHSEHLGVTSGVWKPKVTSFQGKTGPSLVLKSSFPMSVCVFACFVLAFQEPSPSHACLATEADKELAVLKEQLAKSSGELQKAQTELSQAPLRDASRVSGRGAVDRWPWEELQKSLASQQQLQQLKDQLASRDQDLQKAQRGFRQPC